MNKYQHNYASGRPQMYEQKSRIDKAIRIVKLLQDYYQRNDLSNLTVLDVGASTGIIDNELAKSFKKVVGIDIDREAIKHAKKKFPRKNLVFKVGDAMSLDFTNSSFDLVVCTQIYEHVPDDQKLMNEIYRVLKHGGVCYFAGLNKWWPLEPHYNLLFLSWIPKKYANFYLKITGKGKIYYETLRSYSKLKELNKKFVIVEYTSKILKNTSKFGYFNLSRFPVNLMAWLLSPLAKYFAPTFFWILVKK